MPRSGPCTPRFPSSWHCRCRRGRSGDTTTSLSLDQWTQGLSRSLHEVGVVAETLDHGPEAAEAIGTGLVFQCVRAFAAEQGMVASRDGRYFSAVWKTLFEQFGLLTLKDDRGRAGAGYKVGA